MRDPRDQQNAERADENRVRAEPWIPDGVQGRDSELDVVTGFEQPVAPPVGQQNEGNNCTDDEPRVEAQDARLTPAEPCDDLRRTHVASVRIAGARLPAPSHDFRES